MGIDLENWPTLKVQPNMAAEKAGIKDGDVVLKIDGNNIEQIKSSEDAQKFLLGKSGEKVSFTVKRGEQIITFEVVREPLPK
ncbi:MAG: PDZ domain-containing protein [Planctomycetota bacterium]